MVVQTVHQIFSRIILVEVSGVGHRVWPHDATLELVVTSYRLLPPQCTRSEVTMWVRVLRPDGGVGGFAVFAKQLCTFTVGQAVLSIHVEIIFAEKELSLIHI